MNQTQLQLFYFPSCPYCQRVLREIENLQLKVELKNVDEDDKNLEKLIKDTGRQTVPCLYINGVPKHESSEIVAWLQANQATLTKR